MGIGFSTANMNKQIIDPARLIPERTSTPFWKEARRRESLFRDIEKLTTRIERILLDFEQMSLYSPRGLGRCAYHWENELSDKVWNAFYSLDETIRSALSDFRKSAFSPSWDLFEYFGLCDVEYIEAVEAEARRLRMFEIRQDFEAAIASQFFPDDIFSDNLPF